MNQPKLVQYRRQPIVIRDDVFDRMVGKFVGCTVYVAAFQTTTSLIPMAKATGKRRKISLALQGGGAHGAYTWGVLDRLSAEESLEITAISATSAGAMNAVVLGDGYGRGGPEGARGALRRFWKAVSDVARFSSAQRNWYKSQR